MLSSCCRSTAVHQGLIRSSLVIRIQSTNHSATIGSLGASCKLIDQHIIIDCKPMSSVQGRDKPLNDSHSLNIVNCDVWCDPDCQSQSRIEALISDNLTDSISRRAEHSKALLRPQTLQQHQLQPGLPRPLQENDGKCFLLFINANDRQWLLIDILDNLITMLL